MNLTKFSINTRLSLLSAGLISAAVLLGLLGLHTLSDSNVRSSTAMLKMETMEASVNTARMAQVDFKKQVQEWKNLLLRGNDLAKLEKYRKAFSKQSDLTQVDLEKLKGLLGGIGAPTAQIDEAMKVHGELHVKYTLAMKQYDSADQASAHIVDALVEGVDRPPTEKMDAIVENVLALSKQFSARNAKDAADSYRNARALLLGVVLSAVALGSVATFLLIRSVTQPLHFAVQLAETVASGDLSAPILVTREDEIGKLQSALKVMAENLSNTVAQIRSGSDAIATASAQIASGNHDLSSRTEQQAGSLEETASSMEELTSTVTQNADNARQASTLAVSASQVANRGGEVVSKVVATMASINESSKKIVDIIGVIDGIAFQTNILALNAAVEAARAGEQGRGFAVVASEVRNLAQRSAAAAKEIKTLINHSVTTIDGGAKLVEEAGSTMHEIVGSVKRVADIIGEISAATLEQTAGLGQINGAIAQMDQVTQENAGLVEEAAAASEALQDQAAQLVQVVSIFKLDAHRAVEDGVTTGGRARRVAVSEKYLTLC
ncbi:MAG: HAMP domain-containing protein [Aeromicrobium sp.]|nr:HAMP domain-containing protein [Burkholderiales bacterium]